MLPVVVVYPPGTASGFVDEANGANGLNKDEHICLAQFVR